MIKRSRDFQITFPRFRRCREFSYVAPENVVLGSLLRRRLKRGKIVDSGRGLSQFAETREKKVRTRVYGRSRANTVAAAWIVHARRPIFASSSRSTKLNEPTAEATLSSVQVATPRFLNIFENAAVISRAALF